MLYRYKLLISCIILFLMSITLFLNNLPNNAKTVDYSNIIGNHYKPIPKFLKALAFRESSGRYNITSKSGNYFGAYQMGYIAFKELGFNINSYGINNFLSNTKLQDSLVVALLKRNKQYLNTYIKKYNGKVINNIKITESGLLAGANMGIGYVMKFLNSNGVIDPSDGNGVLVSSYIRKLSGYNVSFFHN